MIETAAPIAYQLKVFLIGISPMIWRRFLVGSTSTIADLHYTLQIVMGWHDDHLNQFTIHGKHYGVHHSGGPLFSDDPSQVQLANFQFREREKFRYEYDFTDGWQHQLRIEAIHTLEQPLTAPICLGGKRAAPPEECGGVEAFLAKKQHYSVGHGLEVLMAIRDGGVETVAERYEEIHQLLRWLSLDTFDCKAVNHRLQHYARGEWSKLVVEAI